LQTPLYFTNQKIVAGDFYWLENCGDQIMFAACDCTGHGVPGAMVSVICNNALNRSVREFGLKEPGKILDKTREIVISEFEKSDDEVKDGMDMSLGSLSTLSAHTDLVRCK
jgi:serine phosphatase RsbU (regulator of sigma subunit)